MKQYDIFISYRREDGFSMADSIYQRLINAGYSVFLDLERLGPGKFNVELLSGIEQCQDFILILSPKALDRCVNDDDWVRREVEHAMKCQKNIVPIILAGFEWPLQEDLSEPIKEIPYYHGISVSDVNVFNENIERLKKSFLKSKPKSKFDIFRWLSVLLVVLVALYLGQDELKNLYINIGKPYFELPEGEPEYPSVGDYYQKDFTDSLSYNDYKKVSDNVISKDSLAVIFAAAKAGEEECQFKIGSICYDIGKIKETKQERDYSAYQKDALYWFTKSAKQDYWNAANALGRCYYNGIGVSRDPKNALLWFLKSGNGGCAEGNNNVGKCCYEGFGTNVPNYEKAVEYYKKAAGDGCVSAQYNLGVHYLEGHGVEKDSLEAEKWFRKSVQKGSIQAREFLEMMRIR